ncbi:hypothetical protein D1007_59678 [Hordeum vulgare]|nr:hypothetical protein D1007_59678 [Hordeum vulgare]
MEAPPAGSWEGSIVTYVHIEYHQQTRKIPSAEQVEARTRGGKRVSKPRIGECVVFSTHFIVGLWLPANRFLQKFLDFFGLQMYHVGLNLVMYLACLATISLLLLLGSIEEGRDCVNHPPFSDTSPSRANWNLEVRNDKMTAIAGRMIRLKSSRGLLPSDLVAPFISCRVLPLQERLHRMCDMGMRKDPGRLSTMELLPNKVAANVNAINLFRLDEEA